jgi:hypothetical protein
MAAASWSARAQDGYAAEERGEVGCPYPRPTQRTPSPGTRIPLTPPPSRLRSPRAARHQSWPQRSWLEVTTRANLSPSAATLAAWT